MNRSRRDDYGAHWLGLAGAGIRDRLSGEHARANARRGYLRAPAGRGRVIWIRAGATERGVHLATELLGAIRGRRRDVRLVLTFEEEYREILRAHLVGVERLGFGYGPCDAPRAVRRALERLDPLGVIVVDSPVPENLVVAAQQRGSHVIVYHAGPPARSGVEAAYPADLAQERAWRARSLAQWVAPVADAASILIEAQAEPVLRSLVQGGAGDRALWWIHGADASGFMRAWRASPLAADGVLFASDASGVPAQRSGDFTPISRWDRTPLAPGTRVWVDETRWLPAVAAAAHGAHLETADAPVLWQALAAGVPLTLGPRLADALAQTHAGLDGLGAPAPMPGDVLAAWERLRRDPAHARRSGDAGRRRFWAERRRAGEVLEDLLERVFEW
jgi:hypothetical protein